MPLCVVVTRDVEDRYRGFLGSAMLELAPGVYAYPRMSAGVRDRVWTVLSDWYGQLGRGSIVMTWADTSAAGALGVRTLGSPPKEVIAHEGVLLTRRPLGRGAGIPPLAQETTLAQETSSLISE
ncbi:type I-E CRISPR-associated endoribonuclease Cas2e [Methylobacterium indicum]|uniref:Type I-E CRISPR-associated endoribonuclease Cas2 n=1 Tax=Methylobacterium indicum TaxID=1775910 RepID=A0A8H9C5Q7_9HYPH|nr:type I-E CRISPR-associated endoribonuclease Cas2e [Methylobacterium indicum]BCM83148.1 type I-E CRISPR-associated endoribonuclease Cas2 [Methylobacterium indicum]